MGGALFLGTGFANERQNGGGILEIRLGKLRRRDFKTAIRFARAGMHFEWYTQNPLLLFLYGRYFWCLEFARATQAIAAYRGGTLAGVLLAEVRGEKKPYRRWWRRLYVRLFEAAQGLLFRGGGDVYARANREMFSCYREAHAPDGEITFLAADPALEGRGVGTLLLAELSRREAGREFFLYTDDGCTYAFYEHRGFERAGEKHIVLRLNGKAVPLRCFLYRKRL